MPQSFSKPIHSMKLNVYQKKNQINRSLKDCNYLLAKLICLMSSQRTVLLKGTWNLKIWNLKIVAHWFRKSVNKKRCLSKRYSDFKSLNDNLKKKLGTRKLWCFRISMQHTLIILNTCCIHKFKQLHLFFVRNALNMYLC